MPWMFTCPCGGEVAAGGKAPAGGGECMKCHRVFETAAAVTDAGGGAIHLCGGRARPQRCQVPECTATSVALCDEPVAGGRTCDRRLCRDHRIAVGRNRDRCPDHARQTTLPLPTHH
jgi:hypothetical protein